MRSQATISLVNLTKNGQYPHAVISRHTCPHKGVMLFWFKYRDKHIIWLFRFRDLVLLNVWCVLGYYPVVGDMTIDKELSDTGQYVSSQKSLTITISWCSAQIQGTLSDAATQLHVTMFLFLSGVFYGVHFHSESNVWCDWTGLWSWRSACMCFQFFLGSFWTIFLISLG